MKLGPKALLLPAGLVAGIVFEAFALSFSAALPTTGCMPSSATDAGPVGANTSVCCGGGGTCTDNATCCVAVGASCGNDYECCTGSCSGGQCVANAANTKCKDALGSRCNEGQCACASDDDCCVGTCNTSTVSSLGGTGDGGDNMRCCLESGSPCGNSYDCCSGGCRGDTLQCQ
ncbi:MAG: hypothetical protein ACRELY_33005 [Polyangiaceae bacterium]